jgi:glycosyltransferase involved in cell wall biosynthesis
MNREERIRDRLDVCLVGPAWPYRGGISHYNTYLAAELTKRHEVSIVNYSRLYPDFLFPGKTQYDEGEHSYRVESERLIDSINPFTWVRAGFSIVRRKPDLTVVQWWHPYFAPALSKICSILRLLSRTKIIFVCHNVVPHETSRFDRMLSSIALLFPHGFIVQSQEDRANLLRMRKSATVRVHPLPMFDFFLRGETTKEEARRAVGARDGPLLLFFGYVRPYKGLRYLIEAMPEIADRTGARLLVVGEFYEDKSLYMDLVERLNLTERITFIDRYIGNEEVERYFMASDLVVLPYITATQSGIVQIAMSFDRPMVVTAVGGLPEVVRDGSTGFIVPPGDSKAIGVAVCRFFEEGWSRRMAPNFEEAKKRFSWSELVASLEGLYSDISRRSPGGK